MLPSLTELRWGLTLAMLVHLAARCGERPARSGPSLRDRLSRDWLRRRTARILHRLRLVPVDRALAIAGVQPARGGAAIVAAPGGGNWNVGGTWVGGVVPTAADDVALTVTSGNVTINAAAACRSLDCTGYTGTLTHNLTVTLTVGDATAGAGSVALRFVAGMTYTAASNTAAIALVSTSATVQTVDFAGKTTGAVTYNGAGGSWRLTGAHSTLQASTTVLLTLGTLDTNGQTCSWGIFNSNNANARALILGASAITVFGVGTCWNVTSTLTLDAGTSSITATGAGYTLSVQGLTYHDMTLAGSGARILSSFGTWHDLTVTTSATKTDSVTLNSSSAITVTGTLTLTGNSATNRLMVQSSVLGTTHVVNAAAVSLANVDFMDVVAGGAAAPWTGTSLCDCWGNSGITFTPAVTRYAVAAGNASSTATWAASSGGAPGASVPLGHDTVVLDANSGVGTITFDMPRAGKDVDCTGYAGTLDWGGSPAQLNGSFTLAPGMTFVPGSSLTTFVGRATHTITSAGKTFGPVTISAPGYYGLQDALTSSGRLTHAGGTFDTNAFNVTCSDFTVSGAIAGTILDMGGGGVWTITWAGAPGTIFTTSSTNVAVRNARDTEIVISAASANTRTIALRNHAFGTLTYTVAGSTGVLVVAPASGTAGAFKRINVGPGRTLRVTSAVELTVDEFNVNGAAGDPTTLDALTAGSAHLLRTPGAVRDLSGNGWHSPHVGGLAFGRADGVPGGLLRCPDFDGVDDMTRLPGFNPYVVGSRRTFMGWANRDTDSGSDALLGGLTSNTFLRCSASSRTVQFAPESGNTASFLDALPSLAPTGWFHWCLRYDDATGIVELLINGVSLGTIAVTPLSYDLTPGEFTIGARLGTDEFDGGIAGVSVHDGFVLDATVAALAASQSYTADVLATSGLLAYWPLDESPQAVSCDYLSIKDSSVFGGRWLAGLHSTDVSGNSGWDFQDQLLQPPSIPSAEAFGAGEATRRLSVPSIPSAEAFGVGAAMPQYRLVGIPSAEAFGALKVNQLLRVASIPSGEAFGTGVGYQVLELPSILSAEAFGALEVSYQIRLPSIPSAEAFGVPKIAGVRRGEATVGDRAAHQTVVGER